MSDIKPLPSPNPPPPPVRQGGETVIRSDDKRKKLPK